MVVLGGILTIAIADAFSDALGIHVSEESTKVHTEKEIWAATITTFLTKFFYASLFILPVLVFSLSTAIIVSIFFGLTVLGLLSYYIAKDQKIKPWKVIGEHITIAVIVILITHYVGLVIAHFFR
jgi:vacuolar iron transporter family protein